MPYPSIERTDPPSLTPKQWAFLTLDCLEAFYGGAAGGAKLLALDTPIPTPSGWTTMGALRAGDLVLAETGEPCMVTQAHPVDPAPDSYLLTFDDGSWIEAGAEHRWLTFDAAELGALTKRNPTHRMMRRERRASRVTGHKSAVFTAMITARNRVAPPASLDPPTGRLRTTEEIAATLRLRTGRANHAVPVAQALALPDAELPLDPYLLGAWLGDGTSKAGAITTADVEVLAEFIAAGFPTKHYQRYTYGVTGLRPILRALGVFGNKHIPAEYLRASRGQRLALLQGLMDTDGTTSREAGSVSFTNTSPVIVAGILELIISLGWKARACEGRAKLYGRDIGPKWTIKWTPDEYVFRLGRKRVRQRLAKRRTARFRYVVGCERVPSRPMRCITVDNPAGLYLAGRSMIPTHNSDALLMAALQYVDVPGYAALLLRRTYSDLVLPGALMDRARDWLQGMARWSQDEKTWHFPSTATLTFGYLENDADRYRYQSAEFQFIGFDELTQFSETQYRYLFSRLRRLEGSAVPLRVRSAANPDGIGFEWVKARFVTGGREEGRIFIPAKLEDNPYLDREGYIASLMQLDATTRRRLLHGDWSAQAAGGIFNWWPRYRRDALPVLRKIVTPVDSALGGDDYTAWEAWGWDGARAYLLDFGRFRGEAPEAERRLQYSNLKIKQQYPNVGVMALHRDNVNIDKVMAQHLRAGVPAQTWREGEPEAGRIGMSVAGVRLPTTKGASSGQKREAVARMVSVEFEGGRMLIPEDGWLDGLDEWLDEHIVFPAPGRHDDWVECTNLAGWHLFRSAEYTRPAPVRLYAEGL
jgi:phage terminase large subunit-like protein